MCCHLSLSRSTSYSVVSILLYRVDDMDSIEKAVKHLLTILPESVAQAASLPVVNDDECVCSTEATGRL